MPVDKCIWTVAANAPLDRTVLSDRLLKDLPATLPHTVPSVTAAYVTIQEPREVSNSLIGLAGVTQSVDAVIEVEMDSSYAALDDFNAYLLETWSFVQGWRVKPTLIYDSTKHRPVGEPSESPALLIFVERIEGTSKEHFDRNWYIHAGHLDGREEESEASIAERHREEALSSRLYRQNRVIEPITATTWLVHGYTQLQLGMFVPEFGPEPYERERGEESFDRWPPRLVQGFEHRIK
jgi:hypothetical protein